MRRVRRSIKNTFQSVCDREANANIPDGPAIRGAQGSMVAPVKAEVQLSWAGVTT